MQGFLSVVSPDSFLPFVPVSLSSVSEPCPYPSCLCLPSRTSFFHCSAARLHDHNPQRPMAPLTCAWAFGLVADPCSIELSLTSDLKGIASSGCEIFLCVKSWRTHRQP